MDTHDEANKAGPQKESSPVFRGGPISQGDDTQANSPKQDRQASNPYRLVQSLNEDKDDTKEQPVAAAAATVQGPSLLQQLKNKLFPEKPGVNNTKQKAMVILMPILFVVMIFMFRQVLSKSPKKTKAATDDDTSVVSPVVTDGEIDWQIPEPIPMEMRDPIKPVAQAQTITPSTWQTDFNNVKMLSVRGILYSQDKPSAVIGNRIVHLNDKIDGATVVEIGMDYVVFERNGKRWTKKVAELELEQREQEREPLEIDEQANKIQS